MNLADPELEYIDPTPNVHSLFIHFDTVFFSTKLSGKAVVRWSKRMYSCAGVCSYEGRGGICDIALSEPLLKLRPRKDLVETLLHEMIHAFLFVVGKDQSRNGHGPNFLAHMNRINQAAGLNISIYHDFHDEVRLYQNHVWRCNGPCQKIRPYFGIVRRTRNQAPGPSDCWWNRHRRACGGTFIKCQEPEVPAKPVKVTKKVNKPYADITKYINNNNDTIKSLNKEVSKSVIAKPVFTDSGQTCGRNRTNSVGVLETVRNVWANKTIPRSVTASQSPKVISKAPKRVSDVSQTDSLTPPKKVMKIDDYFKTTASSILKDIYGKDFTVTQSSYTNKLKAVVVKENAVQEKIVNCPVCNAKVSEKTINAHIDECLNKDIIRDLSMEPSTSKIDSINKRRKTVAELPFQSDFKTKVDQKTPNPRQINDPQSMNTIKPEIKIEKDFPFLKTEAKSPIDNVDLTFLIPTTSKIKIEPIKEKKEIKIEKNNFTDLTAYKIKDEPNTSTSKDTSSCPCCGTTINKPIQEHLDECLVFFDNDTTIPEEGSSFGDRTIVIDDSDDEFDETQTYNATGTKSPCPCCMQMVENADMNNHLDTCLGL